MKHTLVKFSLVGVALATACVSPESHRRLQGEKESLQARHDEALKKTESLALENERLRGEVADLSRRAADASWIQEQKQRLNELLAKYGEGTPASVGGVTLVRTPEGYAFRVTGEVLFNSGKAELTEQGKATLRDLAKQLEGRRLRVDGHTDDQPISKSNWKTNLRLSVERAMEVANFLTQHCQLRAEQVGVAGFGEYRPAANGSDDAARKQNRRVEILMLDA